MEVEIYMRRKKYFENYLEYAKKIKEIVNKKVKARIFIFGSVLTEDFSIGLSDIDIAIVSNEFGNKEKKFEILDILFEEFFDSPFEFHVLTEKQWKFYLNFIKRYKEV